MPSIALPEIDARLLAAVQDQVPLVARPYAAIARQLDLSEHQVLDRLTALHAGPRAPVRQIGAIFDSKALGYQSTLVAAVVPDDQLPRAVAAINAHPGVSHNYLRDHAYNLWFTLAVAPDSRLGMEATARVLQRRTGATAMRLLPTLKLYKIGLKLDLGVRGMDRLRTDPVTIPAPIIPLGERDRRCIRLLQRDLPLVTNPFQQWAREAGQSVDELLDSARSFLARRIMRRFSAVLRHRELGFDANAMGVWIVPPDRQDAFGATAAAFPEVSHCYLRPSYPDWPYNLFTMIHTRDRAHAANRLGAIASATGIENYAALYSTHEYKKVRIQYFTGDAQDWESAVTPQEQTPIPMANLEVQS